MHLDFCFFFKSEFLINKCTIIRYRVRLMNASRVSGIIETVIIQRDANKIRIEYH